MACEGLWGLKTTIGVSSKPDTAYADIAALIDLQRTKKGYQKGYGSKGYDSGTKKALASH